MNHWLVKQEPSAYAWAQFVRDKRTDWTGVRNFQARNNLLLMKKGDRVLYYHSNEGKEIVGVAEVTKPAFADPTAESGESWVCVELRPVEPLKTPVGLERIKADPVLKEMALVRQSRLSVMPVSAAQFARVIACGGGKPLGQK
ncbi:MAG: EVE domain-containing protein [Verrucomicrobiae bacterium]|nr:EVE domain-containing protein [Verrucomicrobiae bacterium]